MVLAFDVSLPISVHHLMHKDQISVSLRGQWGIRLEVAIGNVRLNFGHEMGTEWRLKSHSHGPMSTAELCKVERGERREKGLGRQLRQLRTPYSLSQLPRRLPEGVGDGTAYCPVAQLPQGAG